MQAHMRCPGAAPPSRGAEATPAACARDTSDGARRAVQPSVNAITKTSVADTAVGTAPRNRHPPRSAYRGSAVLAAGPRGGDVPGVASRRLPSPQSPPPLVPEYTTLLFL